MSQRALRAIALCAGVLTAPACYSYVPTEMAAVPPGQQVRLLVTRAGSEELARVTESNELRPAVNGQFVRMEGQSLLIRIPVQRDPQGFRPEIGQLVRVPEGEVLAVDRREFSAAKTGMIVGAGVAATGLLLWRVFDVFSDSRNIPPDTELSLIPIFSLIFGR